ncbi:putative proline iminopeptidase [Podospora australis]|uniref:Proline iminopeptidase n=1 Tax=Podospora australis TaxID=1536484 RepID=A0AAN6WSI7_9PEZI|nr:putative proline iminopeptidase [Podospora australis]
MLSKLPIRVEALGRESSDEPIESLYDEVSSCDMENPMQRGGNVEYDRWWRIHQPSTSSSAGSSHAVREIIDDDEFQLEYDATKVSASPDDASDSGISISEPVGYQSRTSFSEPPDILDMSTLPPSAWPSIKPAILVGTPKTNDESSFKTVSLNFQVPLEHSTRLGSQINLHADFIYASTSTPIPAGSNSWIDICRERKVLLFLCGGPGDKNPHDRMPKLNTLLLQKGYVIFYADYRGTGQSSPVRSAASFHGGSNLNDPQTLADYLTMFRQDNIAWDLEAIRLCLSQKIFQHEMKWTVLAQSFGGWIALTYLSFSPDSVERVFLTAGLAPIFRTPDQVYTSLYNRIRTANEEYYTLYPEDVSLVRGIYSQLQGKSFQLPDHSGRRLTSQSFLTLGRKFIAGKRGYEAVHSFVTNLSNDLVRTRAPSERILMEFSRLEGFKLHTRPLYALLHEAIYCSGSSSHWSAYHVARTMGPEFSWIFDRPPDDLDRDKKKERIFFAGEMVFPFMLHDLLPSNSNSNSVKPLSPQPDPDSTPSSLFTKAAQILATKPDWPELYNLHQLQQNPVPVNALAYPEDMCVDFEASLQTAAAINNCEVILPAAKGTPEAKGWTHGGLRSRTEDVVRLLFGDDPAP